MHRDRDGAGGARRRLGVVFRFICAPSRVALPLAVAITLSWSAVTSLTVSESDAFKFKLRQPLRLAVMMPLLSSYLPA